MIDLIWDSVVAKLGIGVAIVVALAAAGWFFPPLRRWLWSAAGMVLAVLAIYGKGASDARRREKERQLENERRAAQRGHDARSAAERDAADGVSDGYQRD